MALNLCGLPLKNQKFQSNHEKNTNRGTLYKLPEQYSSKLSKSSKTREV